MDNVDMNMASLQYGFECVFLNFLFLNNYNCSEDKQMVSLQYEHLNAFLGYLRH